MNDAYEQAGVSIQEGDRFVSLLSPLAKDTHKKGVLNNIGFFSSLFEIDLEQYKKPVIVTSTDGVGTKLKLAEMVGDYSTIGIDLVAMCVNDIITCGAKPVLFLDYLATNKLNADHALQVIEGIALGCKIAGCSLVGGETAEMPNTFVGNGYELSGFSVGLVDKENIITGQDIKVGDRIIGIRSEGVHSNGFSLINKIFEDDKEFLSDTIIKVFLAPTKIYTGVLNIPSIKDVKGMAHITGGGLEANTRRILPDDLDISIAWDALNAPFWAEYIKYYGNISFSEMRKVFNMGIGFVLIASNENAMKIIYELQNEHLYAAIIGRVTV